MTVRIAPCLAAGLLLGAAAAVAQTSPRYHEYIATYAPYAVQEMHAAGIPASITLAQGLLESGAGGSTLARTANNHFGIKCHSSWTGATAHRKDDDRNRHGQLIESCFRKYDDPAESYADHSEFLTSGQRYAGLFLLRPDDYKGWARGLKKAGYATSKTYATKLIDLIETYELHRFDDPSGEAAILALEGHMPSITTQPTDADPTDAEIAFAESAPGRPVLTGATVPAAPRTSTTATRTPAAPAERSERAYGEPAPASVESRATVRTINDVKYTYARAGETLGDVARRTRRFSDDLVNYNEEYAYSTVPLEPGTRIFLQPKRKNFRGKSKKHKVRGGETFQEIADRYGLDTEKLMRRNRILVDGREPRGGQVVYLRGRRSRRDELKTRRADQPEPGAWATVDAAPEPRSRERAEPTREPAEPVETPTTAKPAAPSPEPSTESIDPAAAQSEPAAPELTTVGPRYVTVEAGDSLWKISRRVDVSVEQLRALNDLEGNLIQPGQRLVVGK